MVGIAVSVADLGQSASNIVLDKPAASTDAHRRAALASVARVLHRAGPARLLPAPEPTARTRPEEPRLHPGKRVLVYLGILAGPEEPPEVVETWLRVLTQVALLTLTCFQYAVAQNVAGRPDVGRWAGLATATVLCLPLLYGSLRLARIPKRAASILAVMFHAAWSVLVLLDRLPWPAPDFGTK